MRNRGFTILELMLAVGLLAILASFAIPAFRSTAERSQLAACSNKVASAIQHAKSEAITQRANISVTFGEQNDLPFYQVGNDANSDGVLDDVLQELRCEGNGLEVDVSDDLTFVSFGATGFRVDGAGQVTVTTCNQNDNGRVLTISAGGGASVSTAPSGGCS